MRKVLLLLLVILGVCFLFLPKSEEIRIRVIANSDDTLDIKYKEEVVYYLKSEILRDKKLTDEYFKTNYLLIEKELNQKYTDIKVSYEYHNFDEKTYNGSVLIKGKYKTLVVRIGKSLGSNWWSSICDGVIEKESDEKIKYEWYFLKGE